MAASAFEVEPEDEKVTGHCECCGNVSRACDAILAQEEGVAEILGDYVIGKPGE